MTQAERNLPLASIVHQLREARMVWRGSHYGGAAHPRRLPVWSSVEAIVGLLREALFPLRLGTADIDPHNEDDFVHARLQNALLGLVEQVALELMLDSASSNETEAAQRSHTIVQEFAQMLPDIRRLLDTDIEAAFDGDPAARSFDEVLLCYPGIAAIIHHRLAHLLYKLGAPLVACIIAEIAHARTGIDIHPGADIGPSFFIDHGTGVVIGETAIIGAHVRIYQAVTLGAKRFPRDSSGRLTKNTPRHPIIEDHVVIYAGATILGRVTIGAGSIIGGNVWLTQSTPPNSRVFQAPTQAADDIAERHF